MSTFFLGLDLGQTADYSALIVAEKITPQPARPPADIRPRYDIRHIGVCVATERKLGWGK